MRKRLFVIALIVIFLLSSPVLASSTATSDAALNFVRTSVNRVLAVLRDPSYKTKSAKEDQRRKLRALAEELFDFREVSRLALGRNRRSFTPQQMEEFYDLFRRLLERTYIDKIQTYTDEKVVYDKAIMLSDTKALVKTDVITGAQEIPINYRLVFRHNKWMGYDVIVEGVSLVKNYRSQFNLFLQEKTPAELLKVLQNKISTKT